MAEARLISRKLLRRDYQDGRVMLQFWCQGCGETHSIWAEGGEPGRAWSWNGDVDRPVFSPSVLTRSGHHAYDTPQETCWCTYRRDHPGEENVPKCQRCHTFVGCNGAQPGEVIFLSDCTHSLAGTVQPLPDLPAHILERLSCPPP